MSLDGNYKLLIKKLNTLPLPFKIRGEVIQRQTRAEIMNLSYQPRYHK